MLKVDPNQRIPEDGISWQAHRSLLNAGIVTVGDLAQQTRADMLRLNGIGSVTLRKLEALLAEHELSFTPDQASIKRLSQAQK